MDDADDPQDEDFDDAAAQLAEMERRLRKTRLRLVRTIEAISRNRRTPEQIQDVIHRARATVQKSLVIRQKLQNRFRVH
jgi:hypothetical protein